MFILRLYVLEGCPSCQQAIQFIQSKHLPVDVIVANGDPIIAAGNKIMNNGEDKYPVLMCNIADASGKKDLVVGYKPEDFERVCKTAGTLFGPSAWHTSNSQQPNNGEAAASTAEAVATTN